jgi:hypothetical protein
MVGFAEFHCTRQVFETTGFEGAIGRRDRDVAYSALNDSNRSSPLVPWSSW